jgi:PAS domain S-box-containing protein
MSTPPTIMVVEDERLVAKDLEMTLRRLGYDVCFTTASGEAAVELAESKRPDLVLMDVRLRGGMDGVEAARLIQFRHDVPIVYLTAFADDVTLRRALETEPCGYLVKPFQEKELHTTIETALSKNRLERLLRESEERYRALSEAMPQMVWTAQKDGAMEYFNQRWLDYTGLSLAESQGDGWQRVVHPYDLPDLAEGWRTVFDAGVDFEIECRLKRNLDQRYIWHLVRGQPLRNLKDSLKWCGTFTDIEFEKQTKEALHRSAAQKYALMDASPDAIVTLDLEGRVLELNPATERIFGWSRAKVIGKALAGTLLPPEGIETQRQVFAGLLDNDHGQASIRCAVMTLLRADGGHETVEMSVAPVQGVSPPMFTAYLRPTSGKLALRGQVQERTLAWTNAHSAVLMKCAGCKREMDATGRWQAAATEQLELDSSKANQGFCPQCAAKLWSEMSTA